jgi:hypothetical protein
MGEVDAGDARDRRKQKRFRQQHAHEPRSSCSERQPDRHLTLSCVGTRQQQGRDVRARDEHEAHQDAHDEGDDRDDSGCRSGFVDFGAVRHDDGGRLSRMDAIQLRREKIQLRGGRRPRYTRRKSSCEAEPPVVRGRTVDAI